LSCQCHWLFFLKSQTFGANVSLLGTFPQFLNFYYICSLIVTFPCFELWVLILKTNFFSWSQNYHESFLCTSPWAFFL
jgi:hypothetical protein